MILVTGGNGLLGMHILYTLCAQEEMVRASYRNPSKIEKVKRIFLSYPDGEKRWEKIEWRKANLTELYEVEDLLDGINQLYHCAAMVSLDPKDAYKMYFNNTESTAHIVNIGLVKKSFRMIHVSSVAALGESKNGELISEATVWNDARKKGAYAKSKFSSEQIVWRGIEEGLDACIVNPSIILGPGSWDSGSAQLFRKIDRGFPFYTNATQGVVDVRDCTKAMIQLMGSEIKSERFILSAENKEMKAMMYEIAQIMGRKAPWIEIKPWVGQLAWRLNAFWSFISRSRPTITKDMIQSGTNSSFYDNSKSKTKLGLEYRELSESLKFVSEKYQSLEG